MGKTTPYCNNFGKGKLESVLIIGDKTGFYFAKGDIAVKKIMCM
jgi:hypothetical protein